MTTKKINSYKRSINSFSEYIGPKSVFLSLSVHYQWEKTWTVCQWTSAWITNQSLKQLLEFTGVLMGATGSPTRCCFLQATWLRDIVHSQFSLWFNNSCYCYQVVSPGGTYNGHEDKLDCLTILQFVSNRLAVKGQFSNRQQSKKLFKQYIVVMYVRIESSLLLKLRLLQIKHF